jgi:carboxylesterase
VKRAIVFVHGYTSCPQQFSELGNLFYQQGYNVLIIPVPRHGLADRMTEEQARLTAEELAAYGDRAVDIAQGLGDHVTVVGFSMGGVVTGWAAQNRADIDLAVLISPGFGFAQVPPALMLPTKNFYSLVPNSFEWWDPVLKENIGPAHAYPRYATRTLAQILRLSFAVQSQARQSGPRAQTIWVVTNSNDTAVSRPLIERVVSLWLERAASKIQTYDFPPELRLGHDLIDPLQPDQRTDVVYPKLLEIIDESY